MKVLLTGGAGFIGSHTAIELIKAGHEIVIVDNFVNSSRESIRRVEKITKSSIKVFDLDIRNSVGLDKIFEAEQIDAVIHFAGLKAVGESVAQPLRYYDCNVGGALVVCEEMAEAGIKTLIFSSSATVYGDPASVPIREDFPRSATNPYGASKLMIEDILADVVKADPDWRIACLRYFNPVGAHPSGLIGEDPSGIPNNLMPFVTQVAIGKRPLLNVYGSDYPTPDGTGVRDYIHVQDLAEGHVAALQALLATQKSFTVNLGTGCGNSVLEVVNAFEKASGRPVHYQIAPRRPGDVAQCYADPALARQLLGWTASRSLADMCLDAWRWQSGNPEGYEPG